MEKLTEENRQEGEKEVDEYEEEGVQVRHAKHESGCDSYDFFVLTRLGFFIFFPIQK